MSTTRPEHRPFPPRPMHQYGALLAELAAVILIVVGGCGLVTAAFATDLWLGIAALSVAAIAAGVALGLDR